GGGVGAGDGGVLADSQSGDGLGEGEVGIEVGVIGGTAITGIPTGVERELSEVGEAEFAAGAGCGAAVEGAEFFEADGCGALGLEVGAEEALVGDLVVGVFVDVLRHVVVNTGERGSVQGIAGAGWFFAVLDATELVVLDPEVGFEDFG